MKADTFLRQWLLLALTLLIPGLVMGFNLIREHGRIGAREQARLFHQSAIIEEILVKKFETVAQVLAGLLEELGEAEGVMPPPRRLKTLSDAMPDVSGLLITDARGIALVSSQPELVGHSVSSREYFTVPRNNPQAKTLFVSPPFEAGAGEQVISLSRVVSGPDGQFFGVVSATLAPVYFSTLLHSVLYASDMWTALVHGDGVLFLMVPKPEGLTAIDLARPGSFFTRHMESGLKDSVFSGVLFPSAEERLLVQRTVRPPGLGMDKSLMVVASRDLRAVYADWRRDLVLQGGLFVLFSLACAAGLYKNQQRQRVFLKLAADHALILDSVGEGIVSLDTGGRIIFMNRAAEQISGWASSEVIGRDCHFLLKNICTGGDRCLSENCPIRATMADGKVRSLEEGYVVRSNGQSVPVALSITPTSEKRPFAGCVLLFQDITERKKMEAALLELATTDELTALPNRRYFLGRLDRELARLQRLGGATALLMLDIDHFKQVNDVFGHGAGDEVLRHFAALLQASLRRTDMAGRLGGEEFALLLPGMPEKNTGLFAEKLREQVAASVVETGKGPVTYTVSIGVTLLAKNDATPDVALARADAALYRAKESGRNRVETKLPAVAL